MIIKNGYEFGDIVYLRTDPDQLQRMVTSFRVMPGLILYGLSIAGDNETSHHFIELTNEKTLIL